MWWHRLICKTDYADKDSTSGLNTCNTPNSVNYSNKTESERIIDVSFYSWNIFSFKIYCIRINTINIKILSVLRRNNANSAENQDTVCSSAELSGPALWLFSIYLLPLFSMAIRKSVPHSGSPVFCRLWTFQGFPLIYARTTHHFVKHLACSLVKSCQQSASYETDLQHHLGWNHMSQQHCCHHRPHFVQSCSVNRKKLRISGISDQY